jgi:hypothetical protein
MKLSSNYEVLGTPMTQNFSPKQENVKWRAVFCFTIVKRQPKTAAVALDTSKTIIQCVASELRIDGGNI